jgi:hypothetical protein
VRSQCVCVCVCVCVRGVACEGLGWASSGGLRSAAPSETTREEPTLGRGETDGRALNQWDRGKENGGDKNGRGVWSAARSRSW